MDWNVLYSMNELYHSGSILILYFSGISGSHFLSNDNVHIPVEFTENKGFVHLNTSMSKDELINDYMFLRTDGYYLTKYKMTI